MPSACVPTAGNHTKSNTPPGCPPGPRTSSSDAGCEVRTITELINEGLDRLARGPGVELVQRFGNSRYGLVQQCQRSPIDFRPPFERDVTTEIDLIQARVQHKKTVCIPERIDKRTGYVCEDLNRNTLWHIRRRTCQKVPAQGVGRNRIEHILRIDDVAHRLRHFLAIFVNDQIQANTVLVRDAV